MAMRIINLGRYTTVFLKGNILPILIAALIFTASGRVNADTITFVADEWCPYNCTPNGSYPGIFIEIAKQVFEPAGHTISYSNLAWNKAIEESRLGKYNGIVGAYKDDAPDFIFPEEAALESGQTLFVLSSSTWVFNNIESFKSIKLGVIEGYSYGKELDLYIKENQADSNRIFVANGDEGLNRLLKMLLEKKLAVIVEDRNVMKHKLTVRGLRNATRIAGEFGNEAIHIAFSPALPKSKEYAKILTDGLKRLKENGELDVIKKRYGLL